MADTGEEEIEETLQEPHPIPDPGESTVTPNALARISALIQMSLAFIMYLYVIFTLITKLLIPTSITPFATHPALPHNSTTNVTSLVYNIIHNGVLMCLFLIQHSLMAHMNIVFLLDKLNMACYARAIYVLCTCIVLQIINWLWRPLDNSVWHCSDGSTLFYVIMAAIHCLSWTLLLFAVFATDYLELLGIKQLYYEYSGYSDPPLQTKSQEQRDLLGHFRHPTILPPLVLLWAVPTMTYDRLLLAVMVPLYIIWGSKLTPDDVFYVNEMHQEKKKTLLSKKFD